MAKMKATVKAGPKPPGDSKQGLIIALVFSVMVVIGLGVSTYYGFADQQKFKDEKAEADKNKKNIEKSRDWHQFKAALLAAYIRGATNEERIVIDAKRPDFDKGDLGKDDPERKAIEELVKKMEDPNTGLVKWDAKNKRPATDLSNVIARLNDKQKELQDGLTKSDQDNEKNLKEVRELLAANIKQTQELDAKLKQAEKEKGDIEKAKSEAFISLTNQVDKMRKEQDVLVKNFLDERTKLNKQIADLDKEKKELMKSRDALLISQEKVDLLDSEVAKGKIVTVDNTGRSVYINLGSKDNVKPQLKFSIFSAGTYKGNRDPKAKIEVTAVVSAHLSTARVTEVLDENRDPIRVNDLIYNPAWSPTLKMHVAIAGLVDLNGDGLDNRAEFMRDLEKQGVLVDAYLDLKELTIKGPGMNLQTSYLVLGDNPTFKEGVPLKDSDPTFVRNRDISSRMADMQQQAAKLGIHIIPLRRFMALVGYRLPPKVDADFTLRTTKPPKPSEAPRKAPKVEDPKDASGDKPKDK